MRLMVVAAVVAAAGACALERNGAFDTSSASSGVGGGVTASSTSVASTAVASSSATTASSGGMGGAPSTSGGAGAGPGPLDCTSADLLACYRFENDTLDSSLAGHHLTASGTVQYMSGVDGQAVHIAGDTILLSPANSGWASTAFTIEMWIRPQTPPPVRAALLDNGCCYSMFLQANGNLRCIAGAGQAEGGTVQAAVRTHVACVHDGLSLTAYVNGMLVDVESASAVIAVSTETGIGIDLPRLDERLDGDIDSVRIWRVGLDATQICAAADC